MKQKTRGVEVLKQLKRSIAKAHQLLTQARQAKTTWNFMFQQRLRSYFYVGFQVASVYGRILYGPLEIGLRSSEANL